MDGLPHWQVPRAARSQGTRLEGGGEKVWAVKLVLAYLRGELRWAPVHKGCCLGCNGGFMRKVPAVLRM